MATRLIDVEERRARLVDRHWLAPPKRQEPVRTVESLAGRLCGLHATDPASVYLATRARVPGTTVAAIDEAWYGRRSVVKALGMRRTVFVVPTDRLSVMHWACTEAIEHRERAAVIKLLEESGIAADGAAWLAAVEADIVTVLEARGELTGAELSKAVPALAAKVRLFEDKSYGGEVAMSTRTLFLLGCAGVLVRGRPKGTWISSQHRWALATSALGGALQPIEPAVARAHLARAWLAAFGPATAKDLQWWAGWNLGHTRAALQAIGAVEVRLADGAVGYVNADDLDPVPRTADPAVALLPSLDPTAMGWTERDWYLGEHRAALFDRSGNIGPTVWANGRIVGGWAVRTSGEVVTRLFEDVGTEIGGRVDQAAAEVHEWLAGTVVTPRFPTPTDKALRA